MREQRAQPIDPPAIACLPQRFPVIDGIAPELARGAETAMHALVAARLGDSDLAKRYFEQAVAIDLADNHTTIAAGLHMAALGGTWLTAVFGFAGLSLRSNAIAFDPKLPTGWRTLKFGIQWRGRHLRIGIDAAERLLHATLEAGDRMAVFVNDQCQNVQCDTAIVCPLA